MEKPLGIKSYGSIGHLPNSRLGPGDHKVTAGQAAIATSAARLPGAQRPDKHDIIIVTEKLDGSNVACARIQNDIVPLGRAGYKAVSSRFEQHRLFHAWCWKNRERFLAVLKEGERLVGEWLAQAHGTRYDLQGREPFVAFDLMAHHNRAPHEEFSQRISRYFATPFVVSIGPPLPVEDALEALGRYGKYGALDPIEGAVWRVERRGKFDYMTKFVRPDKEDGIYLPEVSGKDAVWNWQ